MTVTTSHTTSSRGACGCGSMPVRSSRHLRDHGAAWGEGLWAQTEISKKLITVINSLYRIFRSSSCLLSVRSAILAKTYAVILGSAGRLSDVA